MSAAVWWEELPATASGPAGKAWKVDVSRLEHTVADTTATLATWLVCWPGAHPFWSWWLVSVIHLRPIPGVKPAHIREVGATHELIVLALDPDRPVPDPRTLRMDELRYLMPPDAEEQVALPSDVQAEELCTLAVRACVDGRFSPDSDHRRLWRTHLQATAQHMRAGVHRTES